MTRLDKGEVYHFISFAKMKLCTTHDWHFFSDDAKWKMGNYYTDLTIAKNCEEEVRDYAEPIMEKFNTNRNRNIRSFLFTCRAIIGDLQEGTTDERAVARFRTAWDIYAAENAKFYKMYAKMIEGVKRIISKYRTFADVTPEDMAKQ